MYLSTSVTRLGYFEKSAPIFLPKVTIRLVNFLVLLKTRLLKLKTTQYAFWAIVGKIGLLFTL